MQTAFVLDTKMQYELEHELLSWSPLCLSFQALLISRFAGIKPDFSFHYYLLFSCMFLGIGLSLIRATLLGILPYHFEGRSLDMALAAVFIGFFSGWLIVPASASYLFSRYGFNLTMFMLAPLMLLHLFGVILFSQEGKRVEKKNLPEHVSLRKSLKQVLTNGKV